MNLLNSIRSFVFCVAPLAIINSAALAQDDFGLLDADDLDTENKSELYQYEPNPNRVRLRSILSDEVLQQFQRGEPILIQVPEDSRIVSAIRIEKFECFKPDPLTIRPRITTKTGVVEIALSPHSLERLDYQPLTIDVYQSDVQTFRIVPANDETIAASSRPPRTIAGDFFVRLKPNNGVAVGFPWSTRFRLTNEIFDLELPYSEIEGIFFGDGNDDSASIVMRNGDNISGKHAWPATIQFETPWGNETIELEQVVSVTRDRSVKLVPSGAENPRWVIEKNQSNQ